MRNIPVFTCPAGTATLVLQEIPFRGLAYVQIRGAEPGRLGELLKDCAAFCRAAGVERVLAAGHPGLAAYPLYAELWRMRAPRSAVPETDAALRPLLPETGEAYRALYNRGMAQVPGAVTCRPEDLPRLLEQGGCYFVYQKSLLLGLGQVEGNRLLSLVAARPGAGSDVAAALLSAVDAPFFELEVAAQNRRAVALYTRLGFSFVERTERWVELPPAVGQTDNPVASSKS